MAATCLAEMAIDEERVDEAVAHAKAALQSCRMLRDAAAQSGALLILGAAFEAAKVVSDAAACFVEAGALCEAQGDAEGAELARLRLADIGGDAGVDVASIERPEILREASGAVFAASLRLDVTTDCVFGSDVLVDLGGEASVSEIVAIPGSLEEETIPRLPPCARTYLDDEQRLCIDVADEEPSYAALPECILMRRARRVLAVSGPLGIAWKVLAALDGTRTVRDILTAVSPRDRAAAETFLKLLVAASMLDTSGRPVARFVHAATKKGAILGGGLKDGEVVGLVTDGGYRSFGDAAQVPLTDVVPERLRPFHDLTRQRRSRRDYAGTEITQDELSALLGTACGVTGTMAWADGGSEKEVKLRAYPSSGALYAVEIYPIILRVGDLDAGVYHYSALDSRLSRVHEHAGDEHILPTILPTERAMVSGAAAMICLVGRFRRHEQKYGEGGYRMLVAEAGHISQMLVLVATALGLTARPFGGVFDQLLNRELGLDEAEEQFLLSVIVGHAQQ
jgi:SagB-type dehydrogenase family enzyme